MAALPIGLLKPRWAPAKKRERERLSPGGVLMPEIEEKRWGMESMAEGLEEELCECCSAWFRAPKGRKDSESLRVFLFSVSSSENGRRAAVEECDSSDRSHATFRIPCQGEY